MMLVSRREMFGVIMRVARKKIKVIYVLHVTCYLKKGNIWLCSTNLIIILNLMK